MSDLYLIQYQPAPVVEPWEDADTVVGSGFTETRVGADEFSARAIAARYRGRIAEINRMLGHDEITWEEGSLTEVGGVGRDRETIVVWLSSRGHLLRMAPAEIEEHSLTW